MMDGAFVGLPLIFSHGLIGDFVCMYPGAQCVHLSPETPSLHSLSRGQNVVKLIKNLREASTKALFYAKRVENYLSVKIKGESGYFSLL